MTISLTQAAAERVKTFIAARGRGLGLRLGVRKTGCSGFAYVLNYADDSASLALFRAFGEACRAYRSGLRKAA